MVEEEAFASAVEVVQRCLPSSKRGGEGEFWERLLCYGKRLVQMVSVASIFSSLPAVSDAFQRD